MTKTCQACGKEYQRKPYHHNAKWERMKFCSRECQFRQKVTVPCSTPGCTNLIPGRTASRAHLPAKCIDCKAVRHKARDLAHKEKRRQQKLISKLKP